MKLNDVCSGVAADLEAGNDEKRQNTMGSAAMWAMDSVDSEAYYGLCRLDLNTSVACVMAVQPMSAIRADRMTSHKMIVVLVVFRLKVMLDSSRIRICILKEIVVKGLPYCYHIDAFLGRTKPFEWPTSKGVSSFFYALLLLTVFRAESSFNTHKSQRGENLKKMDRGEVSASRGHGPSYV